MSYHPEYIVVTALARSLRRPIKWIETRREHTLVAGVERDQIHDVEIAATRDGTLVALRDDFVHDLGAYTISGLNLFMPVHPLLAQAIEDALAPFGARVERVPVTRAEIAAMVRRGRRLT